MPSMRLVSLLLPYTCSRTATIRKETSIRTGDAAAHDEDQR
jgi:hypothetical protein